MNTTRRHIIAATVADGTGLIASPGAVLLEGDCVVAAGDVAAIGPVADAERIELPSSVVTPGLVNAHAHLDLTHIGPVAYGSDFSEWLAGILAARNAITEDGIGDSVLQGADLARAGGTVLVGDIAGMWSLQPLHALRRSGLAGVSYLEVFGIGRAQAGSASRMAAILEGVAREESGVVLGISPHAPYTCGMDLYIAAAALGLPLATHLAESLEELQFSATGDGAFADLLRKIGVWDDSITGSNCHPVEQVAESLAKGPALAAHLNYVDDACIERMSQIRLSVAYCPRASAYFGHPHGEHPPHRYRDMLSAGVNVSLGTDSIVCLDTADRISTLDEMRFLHRRDGTDPILLLKMATVNGAKALGFDPGLVSFGPGRIAGVIAMAGTTLNDVLMDDAPPQWVACDAVGALNA